MDGVAVDAGPRRNELYALRTNAIAGATGRFGIDHNGNRTNTDTITTVHTLGHPLPQHTSGN